jgi:hypothetical protein
MTRLRLLHDHDLDAARVSEIVDFVVRRPQVEPLDGDLAIRVRGARGGGYAADRLLHRFPKWAGRARFAVSVATNREEDWPSLHVCGHASTLGRVPYDQRVARFDAGDRRLGRWPMTLIADRYEWLVHVLAHEIRHVVQFDRGRSTSEVDCEIFAEQILDEWRERNRDLTSGRRAR